MLAACHALADWLTSNPRATHRPAGEVPLQVITAAWQPHVHDREDGTVDRAGYTCCVLGQRRTPAAPPRRLRILQRRVDADRR